MICCRKLELGQLEKEGLVATIIILIETWLIQFIHCNIIKKKKTV